MSLHKKLGGYSPKSNPEILTSQKKKSGKHIKKCYINPTSIF